jgi:hypothetical protein
MIIILILKYSEQGVSCELDLTASEEDADKEFCEYQNGLSG